MTKQAPKRGFFRKRKTIRCRSGKRVFLSEAAALTAMVTINETNERKGDPRRLVRAYRCPDCVGFHTTRRESEESGCR